MGINYVRTIEWLLVCMWWLENTRRSFCCFCLLDIMTNSHFKAEILVIATQDNGGLDSIFVSRPCEAISFLPGDFLWLYRLLTPLSKHLWWKSWVVELKKQCCTSTLNTVFCITIKVCENTFYVTHVFSISMWRRIMCWCPDLNSCYGDWNE